MIICIKHSSKKMKIFEILLGTKQKGTWPATQEHICPVHTIENRGGLLSVTYIKSRESNQFWLICTVIQLLSNSLSSERINSYANKMSQNPPKSGNIPFLKTTVTTRKTIQ